MSGNTMGTCPSDAEWWTCIDQSPTFLGCCASNACNGIGCPSDDLRAAGLGTACGTNSDSNDSSYWPYVQCSSGGQWWTCESPSFQGCCDINPCGGGCPANDLHPAAFLYDASATSAASELGSCSPSGWNFATQTSSLSFFSTPSSLSSSASSSVSSSVSSSASSSAASSTSASATSPSA
ncbi:hypothetical protein OIDMADRAFT_128268 [Oidiodendron maius Zn]|uniref:Uncharacterized protein n=1 Tax=Oidiodendron maius (strain Zn) TaxID=913774 RepID=A0A0C3D980_OIDMZ|nr:hypothetical protein OIDMADRAFT_128268 [Oidiodendron maius Zn]